MANKRKNKRVSREQIVERFYYDPAIGRLRYRYDVRGGRYGRGIESGEVAGTLNKYGYRKVIVDGVSIMEHVAIYIYHNDEYDYESMQIDHINLNKADNRIENLRVATPKQNSRNKLVHQSGKPSGVSFVSKRKKFAVYTYDRINGRSKANYYGLYPTEKEAKEILDFIESGRCIYLMASVINRRINGK